ncbi:proline iminopeptidase [Hysterangium stoloniferum]|nr:proline iminopeptidase [Hysterangium stoloniferum]
MNIKAKGDRYENNTLLEWIVEELITFVHIRDIVGDLGSKQRPLVTLHGGPDDNHEYPLVLTALMSTHGISLIFYDQIGSGPSTHLLVKKGDGTIWTGKLFCDELNNLDRHLGEILGARYGTSQPKGLNKLIISDFPVLMELFVQAENRLRNGLSKNVQDTLMKHEGCGTTIFYTLHEWLRFIAMWSVIDPLHNQHCTTIFKNIPKYKWVQFANSSHTPQREETTRHLDIVGSFLA